MNKLGVQAIDYETIYKEYSGKWVALLADEVTVVSSGKTAQNVLKDAQSKGFEDPILFKVPQSSLGYVGMFDEV